MRGLMYFMKESHSTSKRILDNGNYLFSKDGFWHGGIHFSDTVLTEVKATQGIRAIADGELVAYRINDKYLSNDDEEKDLERLYSNGFFLLKHYFKYPIGNKLTFFSLYMHTAKLDKYDLHTHKMLKKDTIRSVEKYIDNNTGKIKELEKDTKLILGNKNPFGRYHIYQIDAEPTSGICTVDDNSVIKIDSRVPYPKDYYKLINKKTPTDTIETFTTPIKIKAGEVVGLVGEYNRSKQINRELLHLEVFTKDDVNTFATKAKEKYEEDTSADKPTPIKIKIKIPKDKKEYKKEEILVVKQDITHTNLRKAYDKNEVGYDTKKVVNPNTKLQIDESTLNSNRYLVTKIKEIDVTSQNWTVHKDYIEDSFEIVETTNTQSEDKIFPMKDVKIIKYKDEKYLHTNEDKYFLYSKCIEQHPITFQWAKIISESSNDDISIFENIKKYLLPEFVEDELKINPLYKELFKQIDKDTNGQIEAQELEDASKEKAVKKLTSKYIVKHSSEWNKEISFPQKIKKIYEEYKDKIKQHLENEEKRIENLNFFEECSSIDGFPSSDKVFHFNPIGLVGEFGKSCSKACKVETIIFKLNNNEDFIVSKETLEMILIEEGYKKFPYVPAATNTSSGVTIGYGYDFGQQTVSQLESDLSGLFTQSEINSFKKVVGLKGVTASKSLNLVSNISTSKDIALKLSAISKKRYAQSTYNIWPEAIKLHPPIVREHYYLLYIIEELN